jgi:hypothetical protein
VILVLKNDSVSGAEKQEKNSRKLEGRRTGPDMNENADDDMSSPLMYKAPSERASAWPLHEKSI